MRVKEKNRRMEMRFLEKLGDITLDDDRRVMIQYRVVYIFMILLSCIMIFVDIMTGRFSYSVPMFAVLNAVNLLLTMGDESCARVARELFPIETILLFTVFIVSGISEGAAVIWVVILPVCGLWLFQIKRGTVLCAIMLCVCMFLFWTPVGKSFLRYSYTASFMLRFPFLFIAFFVVALFLEMIRKATFQNYQYLSRHDALTGALNRFGFQEYIERRLRESPGKRVGFMLFDLDRFKEVNDTYGHFAGDSILKQSAERLQKLCPAPVCRWGGEEFAVFVSEDILTEAYCSAICQKFGKNPMRADDTPISQTVSLGAVSLPYSPDPDIRSMAGIADECLYESKSAGRNRSTFRYLEPEEKPEA